MPLPPKCSTKGGSLLATPSVAAVALSVLSLNVLTVGADVVSEYAALRNFVEEAGCESYFETYFGWTSSLLSPGTTASDICPLTNGDATTGFECDSAQEHIVEIFVIGKNSPQLAGYDESACDLSAVNASLDWSTTFPELTEVEWSYTRSFGDVPQALLSPPELLVLDLKRNNISSIAHLDFSAAGNLEQFDVSHNSIDGTVPGGLADDTFITVVELGYNRFTGTLPSAFAGDAEIVSFNVAHNQLTGSVPNFGSESVFEFLDVSGNAFTGTIPEYVGEFGQGGEGLLTLRMEDNDLTGTIPSALAQLTMLDSIFLTDNRLTGPIPDLSNLVNIGSSADSEGADFGGGNLFLCPIPDPANSIYDTMNCTCGAGSACSGPALANVQLCGFPAPVGDFSCVRDEISGNLPQSCLGSARFNCAACTAGSVSSEAFSTGCTSCDPGYFADGNGFTQCEECAAGQFTAASSASSCENCTAGFAQNLLHQTACESCTPGYFAAAPGATQCALCSPGFFGDGDSQSACSECDAGRFTSTSATTVCVDCPAGQFASVEASSVCGFCAAGRFSSAASATACDPCVAGRASEAGHSACTNCISGSFAFSAGSSRCELCQRGRASAVGAGDATGASICSECEPGYFYDEKGGTACFECSAGYFASGRAASACHGTCNPGYFAPAAASRCDACSVGTYSSDASASSESACQACPPGSFANSTASTACVLCPSGTYAEATAHSTCLACTLKTEFEFGSTSCLFFDTASIIIVTAVIVVVVSVIATVCYFICCVAKRKRKRTSAGSGGSENEGEDSVFASNSHSQRLQVSDGSRLDSPKHLPAGHPYQSQSRPGPSSDAQSPSFEMAQRRYPSQAQARLARQQQYAFEAQQAEYRRQQQTAPNQAAYAMAVPQTAVVPSEDRRTIAYTFVADADDPAQEGEVVDVLETFEDGWLRARRSGGQVGLVPESYCE